MRFDTIWPAEMHARLTESPAIYQSRESGANQYFAFTNHLEPQSNAARQIVLERSRQGAFGRLPIN
jgi:hypothetical protein